jgi:HSP20 family protein
MVSAFADPFDTLFQFQQLLDSLRTSNWLESSPSAGGSFPPLNLFSKGDDIVVVAELPGLNKEEIRIEVRGKTVRIAGTKSVKYPEKAAIHRRERLTGSFDRAVTLPIEIDVDHVKAEYREGVLALFLPRAERDKPRTIKLS